MKIQKKKKYYKDLLKSISLANIENTQDLYNSLYIRGLMKYNALMQSRPDDEEDNKKFKDQLWINLDSTDKFTYLWTKKALKVLKPEDFKKYFWWKIIDNLLEDLYEITETEPKWSSVPLYNVRRYFVNVLARGSLEKAHQQADYYLGTRENVLKILRSILSLEIPEGQFVPGEDNLIYYDSIVYALGIWRKKKPIEVDPEVEALQARLDKLNSESEFGKSKIPDNVKNKALYKRIKAKIRREVNKKGRRWGAYDSGRLVREYKSKGGKYSGKKGKTKSKGKEKMSALDRWYKEKWVDACAWPKRKSCGRTKSKEKIAYCRPSVKVSSKTPKLIQELSKSQIKSRCRRKKRSPKKRIR